MWKAMRGRSFDALRLTVSDAVAEGYPMSAVLSQLHSDVIYKQGLSDLEKALICAKIASVSFDLFQNSCAGLHRNILLSADFFTLFLSQAST
jgi:hypothetical protein